MGNPTNRELAAERSSIGMIAEALQSPEFTSAAAKTSHPPKK
jgi:hypothetical protein